MRRYELVSGVVFALLGATHLVRLAMRWPAQVAGVSVPLWPSALAALFSAGLALWAFRSLRAGPAAVGRGT